MEPSVSFDFLGCLLLEYIAPPLPTVIPPSGVGEKLSVINTEMKN